LAGSGVFGGDGFRFARSHQVIALMRQSAAMALIKLTFAGLTWVQIATKRRVRAEKLNYEFPLYLFDPSSSLLIGS
jgi:hypothetical protein